MKANIKAGIQRQPLWVVSKERNKIVVVSDLHFAVADVFSRNLKNKGIFIEFLMRLQYTTDVKELVINGDFFDAWNLPLQYPPMGNPSELFKRILSTIPDVILALKEIIASGIKVVYIPGNHDMDIDSTTIEEVLPGIVQPSDTFGVGRYITGVRQEIVIEHGHRYDPYSAPDSISNKDLLEASNMIYPPGYFYCRMHSSWILEHRPLVYKRYPVIRRPPLADNIDQTGAYVHAKIIEQLFQHITIREKFEDKIFVLKLQGIIRKYSLQDMYPTEQEDGVITSPILFKNFQRSWPARQRINNVWVRNTFVEAGANAGKPNYYRHCALKQYLDNECTGYDIVVFGHTHVPELYTRRNKYYLNTGTWIDRNSYYSTLTRTFAVIETGIQSFAQLYLYGANGIVNNISAK